VSVTTNQSSRTESVPAETPRVGTIPEDDGKTTRKNHVPVVSDYIDIPEELIQAQQDVILCMDTMQINSLFFLTTVSKKIMYRTTDNEYRPLMQELESTYEVKMNYASAQVHVTEVERSIHFTKERFRATFHKLPFTQLTAIMTKILAVESTNKLNFLQQMAYIPTIAQG
jgi:hypothetical protein